MFLIAKAALKLPSDFPFITQSGIKRRMMPIRGMRKPITYQPTW
jgi:hypothetical protein